jgi:hypothetical protein
MPGFILTDNIFVDQINVLSFGDENHKGIFGGTCQYFDIVDPTASEKNSQSACSIGLQKPRPALTPNH